MRVSPLALLVLALSLPAAAGAQNFATKPFLSVQGRAETTVKPDIFPLDVTLSDTSMDAGKSQQLIEGLAEQVLAGATKRKLAEADIEIGNLSISPQTKWDDKREVESFLGNEYQREIRLRFHNLEDLRAFLGDMPISENVRLETDEFEYSREAELKRKLRRDAIEDAKRAAADMAAAVGKRLLDLHNVSDVAQTTGYAASGYSSSLGTVTVQGGQAIRSSAIVLREGEIKVSANAYLVYLIGD